MTLDRALLQTARGGEGSRFLFREKVLEMMLISSLLPSFLFPWKPNLTFLMTVARKTFGSDEWECRHLSKILNQKKGEEGGKGKGGRGDPDTGEAEKSKPQGHIFS